MYVYIYKYNVCVYIYIYMLQRSKPPQRYHTPTTPQAQGGRRTPSPHYRGEGDSTMADP